MRMRTPASVAVWGMSTSGFLLKSCKVQEIYEMHAHIR